MEKFKQFLSMRNFRKVFYLLLGSLLLASCAEERRALEPKRTVIAGFVDHFSEAANVVVVNFCDPLSEENRFAQNLTESEGAFHTEHAYAFAQNITIRFANGFVNLFVHPGDSVFVHIDGAKVNDDFINAVTFSGDNAERNEELFRWTRNSYKGGVPQFDYNAPPEVFLASVQQKLDVARDSVEAYAERTKASDFLREWAYVDQKFMIANYLMDYAAETNKWDVFTHPMFDVFNENNFQTMYFQYHLSVCMHALVWSDAEISRLFTEKKYVQGLRLTIDALLEKAPKGVVRDLMLFGYLKSGLTQMPELYEALPEIKTAFSQAYFSEKLERVIGKSKEAVPSSLSDTEGKLGEIVYLSGNGPESLPDVQLLKYFAEAYRGKVLYIDVWATWCGPCIANMEYASGLHKYFNEKDVVFINLCLDSKLENWRQAIARYNILGENYFLGENASRLFLSEHNLSGFPSYLIIDMDGKLHKPAPHPTDSEAAIKKIESCFK